MASSGIPTPKIHLNQWQSSDKPERTDFNGDNLKIDTAFTEVNAQLENKANRDEVSKQLGDVMNKAGVFDGTGTLDDATLINHWFEIATAAGVGGLPPIGANYNNSALYVFGQNSTVFTQMLFCGTVDVIYKRRFTQWSVPQWTQWETIATTTPPQVYGLLLAAGHQQYHSCWYYKTQDGCETVYAAIKSNTDIPSGAIVAELPDLYFNSYNIEVDATVAEMKNGNASIRYSATAALDNLGKIRIAHNQPSGVKVCFFQFNFRYGG